MRLLVTIFLLGMCAACATGPSSLPEPAFSPDQLLARRTIGLDPAHYRDEKFWLNPDMVMRHFVDISIQDVDPDNVPRALLRSLRDEWSELNYRRNANFNASDAFQEQQANCLSFSAMVVSLMRHAGVRAYFQRVESTPEWDLDGQVAVAALHINAVVFQHGKHREIDWLPRRDESLYEKKIILTDEEALAEWHNNLGAEALLSKDLPQAFAELSRALRLAPDAAHIWVNLGVIYRRLNMPEHAEASWLIALGHNRRQLQALSNLQHLYVAENQTELADELNGVILNYRKQNPFYHFLLAQKAEKEARFDDAVDHIRRARKMHSDPRFDALLERVQAAAPHS